MRLPYELLSSLANCLLNDMIFQIVIGLMEIQQVTEKHLYQQRQQVLNQHKLDIHSLIRDSSNEQSFSIQFSELLKKQAKEIKILDNNLVEQLDQKVTDQQETLEKAGVPGFYVTKNPTDIKLQMHLINFILRLSQCK
ncbi:gonadal protein gdl-like isoform X2 [Ctenocephalides felis]|nr:gonadal protein gdl-like isoform X2 [Ctenocephalides felis]XP_026467167.1 gonadal protein gdl-like isoform X2 [Ctenocephalides felis]